MSAKTEEETTPKHSSKYVHQFADNMRTDKTSPSCAHFLNSVEIALKYCCLPRRETKPANAIGGQNDELLTFKLPLSLFVACLSLEEHGGRVSRTKC
jgi:hypothetical protein